MKRAVSPNDRLYWSDIKQHALELKSDGCSYVPNFYIEVCWEHDLHYRTHRTLNDEPITREEADSLLKQGIQLRSPFGIFSPMAQWRWIAVRLFGGHAWNHPMKGSPLHEWTCKQE